MSDAESDAVRAAFTVCGQNYGSFCGFHECFDGCEETDVVLKDDVDLREQTDESRVKSEVM